MTTLVIVESPNKVRSIAGYLGDGYVVDSSVGHIRDLPDTKRNPVPAKYKGEPWVRLGVDIEDDFKPYYFVSTDKKQQMAKLKKLLAAADELILATDEDREGEAIAWHLFDELKPKVPVKRIVFNEITKGAILAAMENPRDIDMDLVDAQETRRILDRIYGFEVSPVLWRKIGQGTSAGRVQSVALRLVVERERDRIAFRSASYWDLTATLSAGDGRRHSRPRSSPWTGRSSPPARASTTPGRSRRRTSSRSTRRRPRRSPRQPRASRSRSRRSRPSPTPGTRCRRSAPRRCSRTRPASGAGAPRAPCRSPSASTPTATSPTCAPTRSRCRRPR